MVERRVVPGLGRISPPPFTCGEGWGTPAYGARPLKRLIQQYIENPLAKRILDGRFEEEDTVRLDVEGDRFAFSSKQRAGA